MNAQFVNWKDKLLWFRLLALVVLIASAFGYSGELPGDWQQIGTGIIALINIVLAWLKPKS